MEGDSEWQLSGVQVNLERECGETQKGEGGRGEWRKAEKGSLPLSMGTGRGLAGRSKRQGLVSSFENPFLEAEVSGGGNGGLNRGSRATTRKPLKSCTAEEPISWRYQH